MCPRAIESRSNSTRAVIGIDIGSISSKAIILADTGILSWAIVPSRGNLSAAANDLVSRVLAEANLSIEDISHVVATGYGAASASLADQAILLHLSGQVVVRASSTATTDAAAWSDLTGQLGPRRRQAQRAGYRHCERREATAQVLNQRMAPAHDVRGR